MCIRDSYCTSLSPLPSAATRFIHVIQCFCGTVEEFEDSFASEQCGLFYESLCTGDPTAACGGWNAISVYQRTDYAMVGCFQDDHAFRLMKPKGSAAVMSSAVSWCEEISIDFESALCARCAGKMACRVLKASLRSKGTRLSTSEFCRRSTTYAVKHKFLCITDVELS